MSGAVPAAHAAAAPVPPPAATWHGVSFREAFWVWLRVAALSFGGPAGQIAVMHRIVVDEKRWIGEARFLHALSYCTLLPGPEAQQLAVYIGWLMHRTLGGIVAGTLFVIPGVIAIMALSYVYAGWGQVAVIAALFFGLKAAVLAIVLQAVFRVGSRALKNRVMVGIAAAAFVAIFFLDVPFPLIVLAAGLIGFVGGRAGLDSFEVGGGHAADGTTDRDSLLGEELPDHARPTVAGALRASSVWLALWLVPVAILLATLGTANQIARLRMTPTTAAVIADSAALRARLPRIRSMKGAPRKIHRKHGVKVTQVASSPPRVPARSGLNEPGSRKAAMKPTNCSTMISGPGVVSAMPRPSSISPGASQP